MFSALDQAFLKRSSIILELGYNESALPVLQKYLHLLWGANEELNLISRKMTVDELLDNHVIDCLLPLRHLPSGLRTLADFGSGGGLPGVLYALHLPKAQVHLYEKSPKKQEFLGRCKALAPNLQVHGEIPKDLVSIELVTARGFKPIDVILEMSRSYYQKQGKYFLLKARLEKINEEVLLAQKKFKDLQVQIQSLHSPVLQVERHLVLI